MAAVAVHTPVIEARHNPIVLSPIAVNLISGWGAGTAEAIVCQPLDTTKVRMQIAKSALNTYQSRPTFVRTFVKIIQTQGPTGLYAGLGPVLACMGPKAALRFTSFDLFKKQFTPADGKLTNGRVLAAGLCSGVIEAIAIVTPMEVVKIKLQSGEMFRGELRYRNTLQAVGQIVRESGISGLYNGLAFTAARQSTNQAVIFATYNYLKNQLQARSNEEEIASWKITTIGFLAGCAGPCSNTPIDTVKTRLQRSVPIPGLSEMQRARMIFRQIVAEEGVLALYRGCLPRVIRAGPAQAVSFTVYETIKGFLTSTST